MSKAARKSRAVELRYMKWFRAKLVAVLPRQASMSPAMLIEIFFESCSKAHFKGRQCGFFAGGNLSCHKSPRLNFRSRHFEELFPGLPMWSPQEAIDWLFDRSINGEPEPTVLVSPEIATDVSNRSPIEAPDSVLGALKQACWAMGATDALRKSSVARRCDRTATPAAVNRTSATSF